MSQAVEENRRGHSIHLWGPGRSDTYSGLQISAILMNTPKIKFLGIRFLRIALKSQQSLAGIVLQNRQEIDLLIPEQGGTWAILNETCFFWINTSNQVKESLTVLKKNIQILWDLKEWAVEFSEWPQSLFGGSFSWWGGILSWLMLLSPYWCCFWLLHVSSIV